VGVAHGCRNGTLAVTGSGLRITCRVPAPALCASAHTARCARGVGTRKNVMCNALDEGNESWLTQCAESVELSSTRRLTFRRAIENLALNVAQCAGSSRYMLKEKLSLGRNSALDTSDQVSVDRRPRLCRAQICTVRVVGGCTWSASSIARTIGTRRP